MPRRAGSSITAGPSTSPGAIRHLPVALAEAGVGFSRLDRTDPDAAAALSRVVGEGADLLVDCACFTAADAARLLTVGAGVASTVMISSRRSYVDDAGNHVNGDVPPRFGGPVAETAPTLAPGAGDHDSREGYGPNKVAAERLLLDSGLPVTVLRAVQGARPGARDPREWVFVLGLFAGRRTLPVAHPDAVDHTTAAANTAALIETVAARPGARVLNSADPDAPTVLDVARAVAAAMDRTFDEVLLDPAEAAAHPDLGRTPWDAPSPFVLDTTAAEALGYRPAGSYARRSARRSAGSWRPPAAAPTPACSLPRRSTPPPRTRGWRRGPSIRSAASVREGRLRRGLQVVGVPADEVEVAVGEVVEGLGDVRARRQRRQRAVGVEPGGAQPSCDAARATTSAIGVTTMELPK